MINIVKGTTTYKQVLDECLRILWKDARQQYAEDRIWALSRLYHLERDVADIEPQWERTLLHDLFPHILMYRKTNERGFRWLSMVDSLMWRHIQFADSEDEFNSLVDEFFKMRRSNEIQYPKEMKWKGITEEEKNSIIFSLLERFHGTSVATAWAVTGNDEDKVIITPDPKYWIAKNEAIKSANYIPLPRMPKTLTHWRYEIAVKVAGVYPLKGLFVRSSRFGQMKYELYHARDVENDKWKQENEKS